MFTCNSTKLNSVPIIAYNSNVHFARNDPFSHLRSHMYLVKHSIKLAHKLAHRIAECRMSLYRRGHIDCAWQLHSKGMPHLPLLDERPQLVGCHGHAVKGGEHVLPLDFLRNETKLSEGNLVVLQVRQ